MISSAISHPNKAIVIYWGNKDDMLNIPTRTSLSMTLCGINRDLNYAVTLKPLKDANRDIIFIDGKEDKGEIFDDIERHLDAMRQFTGFSAKLMVATKKTFPIGSGLAGSAAAASALAEAFAALVEDNLDRRQISIMARRGSGSAARSVLGGFVKLMHGSDDHSFGVQLWDEKHWDLRDIIAIVDPGQKKVKSREGMRLSTKTCPAKLYADFVDIAEAHVKEAGEGIASRNLERLGKTYEDDNLLFRRVCINTKPQLDYWSSSTHDVFNSVADLQKEGIPVYAGTDAGPNVHMLVEPKHTKKVIESIETLSGIKEIIHAMPGVGSHKSEENLLKDH